MIRLTNQEGRSDGCCKEREKSACFLRAVLALYVYGIVSAQYTPSYIEGIVLPLDFMIGIPLGFYLLVVRPRRLTLLSSISVIWVGYGLSALALGSTEAGALPYLPIVLVPFELAIAVKESLKVFRGILLTSLTWISLSV